MEGFRDTEDLDGLFSGYAGDGRTGHYDARHGHWGYAATPEEAEEDPWTGATPMYRMHRQEHGMHGHALDAGPSAHAGARQATTACDPEPRPTDPTLQDPNCVFQILRRHFARYTPGAGGGGVRLHRRGVRAGGGAALRQLGPRAHHARSATPSAGPSTPPACR